MQVSNYGGCAISQEAVARWRGMPDSGHWTHCDDELLSPEAQHELELLSLEVWTKNATGWGVNRDG